MEKEGRRTESTDMKTDTDYVGGGEAAGDGDNNWDRCNEDVIRRARAPDGGWGWMVALGTLIVTTMMFSLPFSFGILYSGFMLSVGTSATTIAWIYNLFVVIMHFSIVLNNALVQEFGRRNVGYVSILMCSLSVISSAFSPSVYFIFFSFSLLAGLGAGLGLGNSYTVLPPYFNKNSGKANTFLTAGSTLSQIVFAPLLRYLLELYSYTGAALIYSAILLNSLIGVSFFHPVKWHLKLSSEVSQQPRQDAVKTLTPQEEDLSWAAVTTSETLHIESTLLNPPSTPFNQSLFNHQRPTCGSIASIKSAADSDVPIELAVLSVKESTEHNKPGYATVFGRSLWRVGKTMKSDLMVMRFWRAVVINVSFMLTQLTYYNFAMMLPFVIRAADHTLEEAAWCISLMGIINFVMRLVLSPLTDWRRFSIRCSLMTGYCLKAAAMIVVSFTSELWLFICAAVLFGSGIGASVTMYNPSVIKYLGVQWLPQAFGVSGLMCGLCLGVFGPLLGMIQDVTSSYALSLRLMAAVDVVSAGLWLLMPAAQARDAARELTASTDGA